MDRRTGVFDERETLDDDARRAHQLDLVRRTIGICREAGGLYADKLAEAGIEDLPDLDELARIPVTLKAEAQAARAGLGTFPLPEAKRIFVSPGPHFYASQRRADPPPGPRDTMLAYAFHAMGFRENDIVLNTFSYHLSPGGFGLEDQLTAAGCAVVPAGPHDSALQAEILASLPITGYVGTPTFLRILCDKAAEAGMDPAKDWSLEVAFVTAEKLTEDARADLEQRTGSMVRQIYGSADGLLPAYECWASTGMHLHPNQVLEVLDPETRAPVAIGQPGEAVATLPNPNRPLLRFATGDLVVLRDEPCPCGRTGPRIARVAGRVDEAAKVRGMFVYPAQIDAVVSRHPEVARWRAVVSRNAGGSDDLLVEIEAPDAPDDLPQRLGAELKELIRVRPDVELVAAGSIPDDAKRLEDRRSFDG